MERLRATEAIIRTIVYLFEERQRSKVLSIWKAKQTLLSGLYSGHRSPDRAKPLLQETTKPRWREG